MIINLNNNNCPYRCVHEFWKAHLDQKFKKHYNAKEVSGGRVDVGQYRFANQIGFCFDKCKCTKIVINDIYKNEGYYSESMVLNYKQLHNLRKSRPNMFDNDRWVIKKNASYGGIGVVPFASWNDILRKNITGGANFVLQKEIVPSLYDGYKFDVRPHVLIIKEHNNYQAYMMDYGVVKIKKIKFSKNNNNSFTTFFKKYRPNNYQETLDNFIDVTKKVSEKFVEYISRTNRAYFKGKKEPPYQIMVMGYDIMFDENNNAKLLEINNYPGFLMKHIRHEKRKRELLMGDKIWEKILVPWINNKNHNMDTDEYFTKLA
jgi:hypothetical protein